MIQDAFPLSDIQRGRRDAARLRLRLAARLVLLDGTQHCILTDLSASGARIHPSDAVSVGAQAVLMWGSRFEGFGEVVWVSARECGIAFDERLRDGVLQATRQLNEMERLPEDRDLVRRSAQAFVRSGVRL
jgi:hypothetical protein